MLLSWRVPTFSCGYRRLNTRSGVVLTSVIWMLYNESSRTLGLTLCMQLRSAMQTTLLYGEYAYIHMQMPQNNTRLGVVLTYMVWILYDDSSWIPGLKISMQLRFALEMILLCGEYSYIHMQIPQSNTHLGVVLTYVVWILYDESSPRCSIALTCEWY